MSDTDQIEALRLEVRELKRTIKLLARDLERVKATHQQQPVAEPIRWVFRQQPDGTTTADPILQ